MPFCAKASRKSLACKNLISSACTEIHVTVQRQDCWLYKFLIVCLQWHVFFDYQYKHGHNKKNVLLSFFLSVKSGSMLQLPPWILSVQTYICQGC